MKNKKLKLIALAGVTITAAVMLTGCGNNGVKTYDKEQMNVNIAGMTDQNTAIENNVNQNNNQEQDSENMEALKAIATALKDDKWIEDNIKFKQNSFEQDVATEEQEIKFLKLASNVSVNPAFLVQNHLVDDTDDYKIFLVTYQDGKVNSKTIMEGRILSSFTTVDANNGILCKEYSWMGAEESNFYKINGTEISELDSVTKETIGEDENNIVYYNGSNVCTEEEFNSVKSKYNGYNFVGIGTDLTDENIDKYVYKVENSNNTKTTMSEDEIKKLYLEEIKKADSENESYEKLLDYRVDEVTIVSESDKKSILELDGGRYYKDTDILAYVTYSVKPQDVNNTIWLAGNGAIEGDWIVEKESNVYIRNGELVIVGTSW